MKQRTARSIGQRRNLLLRYQVILNEFEKHNASDVPITAIWRKYIYPQFHISRDTLYTIFNTDIEGELQQLEKVDTAQLSLFG